MGTKKTAVSAPAAEPPEGWGWPSDQPRSKAHYFVDCRSLCERWLYFGELFAGGDDKPTRCAQCRRRLAKRWKVAKA